MAEQTYWIGSLGPFKFDDADSVLDLDPADPRSTYGGVGTPDQKAIVTTGQLHVETAPTTPYHVLREDDLGGIVGDVNGPAGATDNAAVRFDGATGKKIQDSSFIVDDSGHVSSFGGNIKFPAAQVASADANTLDDYEEGTWTPVFAFAGGDGTGATIIHYAAYTKIGRVVYLSTRIVVTKNTDTGALTITGLPFTSKNVANFWQDINMSANIVGAAGEYPIAVIGPNSTTIALNMVPESTAGYSAMDDTDLGANGYFQLNGFYIV